MKITNHIKPRIRKDFHNLKIGQCCFATYDDCDPFVAMVIDGREFVVNITDSELYEITDQALKFVEEIQYVELVVGKPE